MIDLIEIYTDDKYFVDLASVYLKDSLDGHFLVPKNNKVILKNFLSPFGPSLLDKKEILLLLKKKYNIQQKNDVFHIFFEEPIKVAKQQNGKYRPMTAKSLSGKIMLSGKEEACGNFSINIVLDLTY